MHIVLRTKVFQEKLSNIAFMLKHHPEVGENLRVEKSHIVSFLFG